MSDWKRVSRNRRCVFCLKPDWCCYIGPDEAPELVLCMRSESDWPSKNGGWIHDLRKGNTQRRKSRPLTLKRRHIDFSEMLSKFRVEQELIDELASQLGVSSTSLCRLGVGWSPTRQAWTFPMKNGIGEVVGIRLRQLNGKKKSMTGSREGVFIPDGLDASKQFMVAEGPTDAAALMDLGFSAIGRPSCSGGTAHVCRLIRNHSCHRVVIAADPDKPGQLGAENLAKMILPFVKSLCVITPPPGFKDFRDWHQKTATPKDLQQLVDAANTRVLSLKKGARTHG